MHNIRSSLILVSINRPVKPTVVLKNAGSKNGTNVFRSMSELTSTIAAISTGISSKAKPVNVFMITPDALKS